jgi:diacylglycerol kinase family enzyme
MKILFVINPISGATSNDEAILLIHKKAVEKHIDFKFFYTTAENNDDLVQAQLQDYKPDRVIACGGDGTVQLVAKNLMNKDIPVGIVPLGSANGLATALRLPTRLEDAIDLVFDQPRRIMLDLLRFNDDHICTHLADVGINAKLVKNYEIEGDRGMIGYAKHLLQSIKDSPLLKYTVRTSEQLYEKEGYMIVIANANMYGTGIRISHGSVSDGKFEISNIEKVALDEAIKAGLTRFNVFIDKDMFSDVISCEGAEIQINQKVDFQIDGEYMGEVDHLTVSIHPSAIPVLVTNE